MDSNPYSVLARSHPTLGQTVQLLHDSGSGWQPVDWDDEIAGPIIAGSPMAVFEDAVKLDASGVPVAG